LKIDARILNQLKQGIVLFFALAGKEKKYCHKNNGHSAHLRKIFKTKRVQKKKGH
jgi:hypothetical protein